MPNKIDFSKLERLTPREDSWAKVCARLDAEALNVPAKGKILSLAEWILSLCHERRKTWRFMNFQRNYGAI